jgi:dTDP-4-amino-4,6-dideoxygalactose transaminase
MLLMQRQTALSRSENQLSKKDIFVARPSLPPIEQLLPLLEKIWDSNQITNNGPLVRQLEAALAQYLRVKHVTLCSNGTIALLCALKALNLPEGSEVITTPFSFVATASAIVWAGLKPVFVDVRAGSFNIDPQEIIKAISPNTSAILPVHCYGTPCDTEEIQTLADKHQLPLVYDAAHAFGVDCDCGSLLSHGDASVISFHATKVFNTFEGGCVISNHIAMKQSVDRLINFGFIDETTIKGIGINGKMSEFNAAVGLLQLDNVEALIESRKAAYNNYNSRLSSIPALQMPHFENHRSNFGYFPVILDTASASDRDMLYDFLRTKGIYARRYFHPLIVDFPDYNAFKQIGSLTAARNLSDRILCLPIYAGITNEDIDRVCSAIEQWFE